MPVASRRSSAALFLFAAALAGPAAAARREAPPAPAVDPALLGSLAWREIGPYRGGRSAAVEGIRGDRSTYYFGATGGGVWKTTDAGRSWSNVSDGFFGGSIGAVAVAPSDPNVVYVGTGEVTVRGNVSSGDGVWKSTDAGRTWAHVGLGETRHVPRVRVHPADPDLVYVCALGHLYGPNEERGVFRSRDGGASWERVKFVSADAGCVDLALDPTNPRILYAAFWNVRRQPWSLSSGGPGSSLWKSTDGGATWSDLSQNEGLPRGTTGIGGIAVSPADPDNLYLILEAEDGGVFRSRDAGKSWSRTSDDRGLRQRAWYYSRIYADPKDAEGVWVVNVRFHHSKDGGRSFSPVRTPHGDNHDLWIDPDDPSRMIEANDGGANVSEDGGESWTGQDNQPTAQIYRVSVDDAEPWRILGAQQDNSALRIRSRSLGGRSIGARDWEPTAGGESGHIVATPGEPDVVYGGSYGGYLTRYDHRTGQERGVNVWPDDPMGDGAGAARYRFQWNFPIFFSPHDARDSESPRTLYCAAQVLFRSRDEGATWEAISPDLTRADPEKLGPSGGPITKDNTAVEYYATIFAALESPHEPGVLWAGSDDGLVHVSRDAGAHWANVTPAGLPEWSQVNAIEADPFERGGLYLAATRYKLDDDQPLLFHTVDYGASWKRIDGGPNGIARDEFTRVVRADPEHRGLLYAGTEKGLWISFDDGGRWQKLPALDPSNEVAGLPQVPVTDLVVHRGTLVAATQGRGFWALDDLEALRGLEPGMSAGENRLFPPRPTLRVGGRAAVEPRNAGTDPPHGALFHYFLAEEPPADATMKLEISNAAGDLLRTFTREPKREGPDSAKPEKDSRGEDLRQLPAKQGANRFEWDLGTAAPERFDGLVLWNDVDSGPAVPPGSYTARLTVGDWSAEVPVPVLANPLASASRDQLVAQYEFLAAIRDEISAIHSEIRGLRAVRGRLEELEKRAGELEGDAGKALVERSKRLRDDTTAIEERLYQTKNRSEQDPLNFPIRLNDKLGGVYFAAAIGDHPPTAAQIAVRDELAAKADAALGELRELLGRELPEINAAARELDLPFVAPPPEKESGTEKGGG